MTAQSKLNVANLTYKVRQYLQINDTAGDATGSVRIVRSDDEDDD